MLSVIRCDKKLFPIYLVNKDVSVKWEKDGVPVQESNLVRSYRRNVEEFVLR